MIARRAARVRPRSRALRALVCAAAGMLALSACSGESAGASGGDSNIVEGTGLVTTVPAGERKQAPDLTGESTHGEPLALADYRGQVVVLNVWGSWCAPCRAEAPNLAAVAADTEDRGVQFIGINTRDLEAANARAFDRTYGIEYPSFFDPKGNLILEFPRNTLPPQGIPSTLVIDREGGIAVRALKALTEEELREILEPVIAEG
ncbi:TlpA disulfide reductase family protein [Streptomyces alkaliphilus]|uniref:TlpA family protein disulfide reductase n=1 Tax=Streptomyces alkaliphilus TaxID=1472722 RepID=UPI00117C4E42|nr:redoxin domain-containing protein [Streptomyces alkaliphilus]